VIISNLVPFSSIIELAAEITKERGLFHLIEGAETFTIISEQRFYTKITQRFKHRMIEEKKDLVEIMVKMPKEIEHVPGITGYLYSLFGENNINILETMSSWTDTLFVIEEKDAEKAMRILRV
jgi:aspartokinase